MQPRIRRPIFLPFLALILCLFICRSGLAQQSIEQASEKVVKFYLVDMSLVPDAVDNSNPQNSPAPTPSPNLATNGPAKTGNDLSASGKLKFGLKNALFSPGPYIFSSILTLEQHFSEREPDFKGTDDKVADGFSRLGINFCTVATQTILTNGIYPAIFKQNPYYEPSHKKGFGARTMYAISRVIITRGDGGDAQFNISQIAGDLSSSALANLYERSYISPVSGVLHDRIGVGPTFHRFGNMLLFDILRNVVLKEFGPDIKRIVLRR